ncbi:hypothetical protein [Aromatoleum petrolei]|uniref:HupE/UreJ family protein n=1 Tax=Aromatoleum petrolei TaxID=76116 RepID=A0ABX1MLC0_9RHOO|nr:hypothetical protein [Aromatoleum petrolei]NMF87925.1 hypothetical protein [Aromatoleum petrolei]QTQ36707.1 Uncharacterized protein ToN1_25670 [Aromatoleum petrolei]
MTPLRLSTAIALVLVAGPALAHGDHGFVPGLAHMFSSGIEHLPSALVTLVSAFFAVRSTGALRWTLGGLAAAAGALTFAI